MVVLSSAISDDNPEIREARSRNIPIVLRAQMLAEVMRQKNGIAVAGSHGKTTTSSLIAHTLHSAGLDPTAIIGGRVLINEGEASGTRFGQSDLIVAEADESDGSFLYLAPVMTVITNIDHEHLDHYGDLQTLKNAFIKFANDIPFWGLSVVCVESPEIKSILPQLTGRVTTYGLSPQAEWVASHIRGEGEGTRFEVTRAGQRMGEIVIPLPGEHNALNALACLAIADEQGVSFSEAAKALEGFRGVERRFQQIGQSGGIRIIDDYAHHPTELRATLSAARSIHEGRIVAVFQPHRYTRTRDCLMEFAQAFEDCDLIYILDVYSAGEEPIPGISGSALRDSIAASGHKNARFIASRKELLPALTGELNSGDLFLTLGAGDIVRLGPELMASLQTHDPGASHD